MPTIRKEFANKKFISILKNDSGQFPLEATIASKVTEMYEGYGGHYGYPSFPPDRNVGGPFWLSSREHWNEPANVGTIWRGGPANTSLSGSIIATASLPDWLGGNVDPSPFGAQAYNRMKPAQPTWSGLNFLAEMREFPSLLRQRARQLSDIGSYWLALKFGWEPLLRDIKSYVASQRNAQEILKQLLRDNGRPVRRKVILQNAILQDVTQNGTGYGLIQPILDTWFYRKVPTSVDRHKTFDNVWASGRFRYWLPDGPRDVNWTRNMIARIYGLRPSPSVVYNAIPWTWLIDWHTSLGDVIENLEAGVADRQAADYFYVMREKRYVFSRNATAYFSRQTGEPVDVSCLSGQFASIKRRVQGDPFGLNTNPNTLTGMQLSILGALGLSKLR